MVVSKAYELRQNYPNPFNTNTLIEFSILESKHVSLRVYDIQGREVATLIDENRPPGVHKIFFDRQDISSGVYFYRLRAGEFTQTRRMLFIK